MASRELPPPGARLALVHGDYRTGNFLYAPDCTIRGVLDWEMAHIGDPLEDLAWSLDPLWAWPERHLAGGLLPRETAIRHWESSSGMRVDRDAFRWWQVFASLKGLAIWISSTEDFMNGETLASRPFQSTSPQRKQVNPAPRFGHFIWVDSSVALPCDILQRCATFSTSFFLLHPVESVAMWRLRRPLLISPCNRPTAKPSRSILADRIGFSESEFSSIHKYRAIIGNGVDSSGRPRFRRDVVADGPIRSVPSLFVATFLLRTHRFHGHAESSACECDCE